MGRSLMTSGYSSDSTWPPGSGPLPLLSRAMSDFRRHHASKTPAHTQIRVSSRNFICYGWKTAKGNNSPQDCKKLLRTLGRTPTLLNPCLGSGSGLLSGLRGNPQSSHQVLGPHCLRYWGWPETSRKLLEAQDYLQRFFWERTLVPVYRHTPCQAPVPAEEGSSHFLSSLALCGVFF